MRLLSAIYSESRDTVKTPTTSRAQALNMSKTIKRASLAKETRTRRAHSASFDP
jgi:hypothetical protein